MCKVQVLAFVRSRSGEDRRGEEKVLKSFGMYIVTYIIVVVASQNKNSNKKTTRNPTDGPISKV